MRGLRVHRRRPFQPGGGRCRSARQEHRPEEPRRGRDAPCDEEAAAVASADARGEAPLPLIRAAGIPRSPGRTLTRRVHSRAHGQQPGSAPAPEPAPNLPSEFIDRLYTEASFKTQKGRFGGLRGWRPRSGGEGGCSGGGSWAPSRPAPRISRVAVPASHPFAVNAGLVYAVTVNTQTGGQDVGGRG